MNVVTKRVLRDVLVGLLTASLIGFGGIIYSQIPASATFEHLDNFSEVMQKVTEVAGNADEEMWIAVDVPSYGALSQPEYYAEYKSALERMVNSKDPATVNVLWFSEDTHRDYSRILENHSSEKSEYVLNEAKSVRELFHGFATESDLFVLAFQNFWVSRDASGKYHSVVCWFGLRDLSTSEMRGFYTDSSEMAGVLKGTWRMWYAKSRERYMDKLMDFFSIRRKGEGDSSVSSR